MVFESATPRQCRKQRNLRSGLDRLLPYLPRSHPKRDQYNDRQNALAELRRGIPRPIRRIVDPDDARRDVVRIGSIPQGRGSLSRPASCVLKPAPRTAGEDPGSASLKGGEANIRKVGAAETIRRGCRYHFVRTPVCCRVDYVAVLISPRGLFRPRPHQRRPTDDVASSAIIPRDAE